MLTLGVSYGHAASPLDMSEYDITKTSVGTQITQETMQRWQSYGWNFDSKGLKVYELTPGDYLVAPASAKVELESIQCSDGSIKLEPRIVTASPSDSLLRAKGISPMEEPYWDLVASECFTRIENSKGWIDHCYQMHKLVGETDSQKDYYELHHYATAKSKSVWTLFEASLSCEKYEGSSIMEWLDWSPGSDVPRGQCSDITVGISAFGVGISVGHTICPENWDITKSDEAGKFANRWIGSAGAQSVRLRT